MRSTATPRVVEMNLGILPPDSWDLCKRYPGLMTARFDFSIIAHHEVYKYEERIRAVKLYIKLGKRLRATTRHTAYSANIRPNGYHQIKSATDMRNKRDSHPESGVRP